MSASRVKTLGEHAFKVVIANINTITDLGVTPYRVAKPILEVCNPSQVAEIERNSPHLKQDDQEIWQMFCTRHFLDVAAAQKQSDFEPPKSWRKYYHVCLQRQREMERDAGSRLRNRYQAHEAEKKGRQLIFTDAIHPMKRRKTGAGSWGQGPSKPRTLYDKARQDTRKIASVYTGPPGTTPTTASRPRPVHVLQQPATMKSSTSSAYALDVIPVPIRASTTWQPSTTLSTVPASSEPIAAPPAPAPNPNAVPSPMRPIPSRLPPKDPAKSMFIPKRKAYSQLPSRT